MNELHGVAGNILKAYSIMKSNKTLNEKGAIVKLSMNGME